MMWTCPNCKVNTENEECPQCGLPFSQGEGSPATKMLKNALSSPAFIVATVCVTAAFLLSIALNVMQYNPFSVDDLKEATQAVGQFITIPEDFVDQMSVQLNSPSSTVTRYSVNPFGLLMIVGLWLLVVQGCSKKRPYVQKGGMVCLKITFIVNIVALSIALFFVILGVIALCCFRQEILQSFNNIPAELSSLGKLGTDLFSSSYFIMTVLILCGILSVILLVSLLFFAALKRSMSVIQYTASSGNFTQKRVSKFAAIILIIMFAFSLCSGLFTLILDMNMEGIVVLLSAIAYLLFAITLLQYRKQITNVYARYVEGVNGDQQDYMPEKPIVEENIPMVSAESFAAAPAVAPAAPVAEVPVEQPVYEEPVYEQLVEEPVYEEPVYEQPAYEEPAYTEPVYEQTAYEEPVYEEPVYEQPVYEQPVAPAPAPIPPQPVQAPMSTPMPAQTPPPAPTKMPAPTQPVTKPVQPAAPVQPAQPVAPSQPVQPTVPAQPTQQAKPQDEFEAFFARQQAAQQQQEQQALNKGKNVCPRCGQPVNNPYFCMNCGLRLK